MRQVSGLDSGFGGKVFGFEMGVQEWGLGVGGGVWVGVGLEVSRTVSVVHLGRSTCHAVSGRGD